MKSDYIKIVEDTRIEIDAIRTWIKKDRNQLDSKTKYLISYCVVKASGTIEVIYKHIIYDYLVEGAKQETSNYIEKMILDSSSNPSTNLISKMLESISAEWRESFDSKVKGTEEKSDLNSLVQLRNDFSHGSSISTSIDTVVRFFESGVKVLEILDEIVI